MLFLRLLLLSLTLQYYYLFSCWLSFFLYFFQRLLLHLPFRPNIWFIFLNNFSCNSLNINLVRHWKQLWQVDLWYFSQCPPSIDLIFRRLLVSSRLQDLFWPVSLLLLFISSLLVNLQKCLLNSCLDSSRWLLFINFIPRSIR